MITLPSKDSTKSKTRKSLSLRKSTRCMIAVILLMVLLNLLAWCSTSFSDWYAETVFPRLSRTFSRFCGWISFSVGEVLIAIALFLVIALPLAFVLCMIFARGKRWKVSCGFGRAVGWILTYILVTETCNCFILYHATPFGERYFRMRDYTGQELLTLYSDLVETANTLAVQVQRDENGCFVLQDDLYETANAAMQKLGETYSQFRGNYPQPKEIGASYIMSQMNLTGIYFPFTLEANYNGDMLDINKPNTVCHELSHLRGRIQEDEAGFLAYLACIGSESIDFQYSGTVAALEYVQNAVVSRDITGKGAVMDTLCDEARQDMFVFLPENYWETKQETVPAVVATQTVLETSSSAMDTSLKLNGVDDGKQSYSRVVTLLLAYWDSQGKLS